MKHIDSEFDENLKKARALLPKIKQRLAYHDDDEGLPEDLDDITSQRQIEAFEYWSASLEDEVLELLGLAEDMQARGTMRENFYEAEEEKLPDEGSRTGYRVGE